MTQIGKQLYPYTDVKDTTNNAVKVRGTNDSGVSERLATEATLENLDATIVDSVYTGGTSKGLGVRGRTNSGTDERLATQSDQATQTTYLTSISGYTSSIPTIASAIETKVYVTKDSIGFGINSTGSAFDEDNKSTARLKYQTQNIQVFEVTEESSTYNIDKVSDPRELEYAEINQISIAGFNFSTDTALRFKFYFWNTTTDSYESFYDYVVGYGSPNYNAENRDIKFFPNVVGNWNTDENRYGYFEITNLGTATKQDYHFFVNITVTPFSKNA